MDGVECDKGFGVCMASGDAVSSKTIRFGGQFEVDLGAYELRKDGQPIKLGRIPMELLLFLIEQRGQLVTRDQIVERIWGKDVFLDTDNSINAAIRRVRQVLEDNPDEPRYVQTVVGRGYRFIAAAHESGSFISQGSSTSTASAENLLGRKISHYRVLELVGGGGMGVVYKAEDLRLGRLVAVKFLPSETVTNASAFERLQREARAASALDHPNICSIYQLGDHEGQPFIVMQLLEGQTLREWITAEAGQATADRVARLADLGVQICEGLEAAHTKGIIHRDIKPANLFVTSRGQAKILDFGVAQFSDPAELAIEESAGEEDRHGIAAPHVTRTGMSVGTPSYLSPEQIRREKLDARTDLFSFGLVLYEMATGKRAFSGDTVTVICGAVLRQSPVPICQADPGIPVELERIINKCLEKDPDKRYESAAALREDLAGLRKVPTLPLHGNQRLGVRVAIGLAVVLAIGVGVNVGGVRERLFRGSQAAQLAAPQKVRPSVAVLGFKNLSGKDEKAWISTAVAEMLGTDLSAGERLRLIPGENVVRMKIDMALPAADSYGSETLTKIREHLSSDLVVFGSYLAVGQSGEGKIRLDVQLQDARAGETVAVISEDGTEADLAELVSRSGSRLREALKTGTASPNDANQVRSALPRNPDAARFYAEGLSKLRMFDALAARELLLKAVAAEPDHALSHAALSASLSALGYDLKAQEEAKKAFDLSSNLQREHQLSVEGQYRVATHEWPRAVEIYGMLWEFYPDCLEYGLALAHAQTAGGHGKDALATVEKLSRTSLASDSDARIDLAEAEIADKLGDFHRAETAAARAVEKGQRVGERTITARALLRRGSVQIALGDYKNAVGNLSAAQRIFADLGEQKGVFEALLDQGIVARHQSNLSEAKKLLEQSLEIAQRSGDKLSTKVSLTNIGNVLWDEGNLDAGIERYRQSLKISREIGPETEQAAALNNIASALMIQGKFAEAQEAFDETLRLTRKIGDRDGEGTALQNIGDFLLRQGKLTAANRTAQEALKVEREVGEKSTEAYALQTLGTVMMEQGDIVSSRTHFNDAMNIRHQLGEKVTEAESQLALAQLLLETGEARESEAECRRLLPIFHAAGAIDDEALTYSLLALAVAEQGRSPEAQQAAEKSKNNLNKVQDRAVRMQIEMFAAYVLGMTNTQTSSAKGNAANVAEAMRALDSIRERASRQGYVGLEMESRLRLGEVELRTVKANFSRRQLEQLQTDAQSRGLLLIARKAKGLLEQHIAEEVRKQEPSRPSKDH